MEAHRQRCSLVIIPVDADTNKSCSVANSLKTIPIHLRIHLV